MATTPTLGLPYPTPDDTVDVPRDVQALAMALDPLGTVPVGAMMMWLAAASPTGWLLMLGQLVPASTYPGLALVFGSSGGQVTIPDMRDVFPAGAGASMALGSTGGAASVLLTAAQSGMQAHDHNGATAAASTPDHLHVRPGNGDYGIYRAGDTINWPGAGAQSFVQFNAPSTGAADRSLAHAHAIAAQAARDATAAHENRPPYRAVNFIVRAG